MDPLHTHPWRLNPGCETSTQAAQNSAKKKKKLHFKWEGIHFLKRENNSSRQITNLKNRAVFEGPQNLYANPFPQNKAPHQAGGGKLQAQHCEG